MCVHKLVCISSLKLKTYSVYIVIWEWRKQESTVLFSRFLIIVFAFALILLKLPRLLLRLTCILYIVKRTPALWEPQFSLSMGHSSTCFVWSTSNRAQSQGRAFMREVGGNFMHHIIGGALCPFQLLPTSWGPERGDTSPLACLLDSVRSSLPSPKAFSLVEENKASRESRTIVKRSVQGSESHTPLSYFSSSPQCLVP